MGYALEKDFLLSLSGLHFDSVMSLLMERCGSDFDIAEFSHLSSSHWQQHVQQHGIPVKTGFFTLLAHIQERQLPFCLATNSRREDALYCLKLAGLEQVFPLQVCRDDVRHGKPAPDIFLKAATLLNTTISDCLILEDSATGVHAAVAAGGPCLFIPSVLPANTGAASLALAVLDDLEQVCGFV
jgi:beta-phosphoglucomutase-like phosphatase (HAD superfamily)